MSGQPAETIPRRADRLEAGRFPGGRSAIASATTTLAHLIDSAAGHGLDVGALTAAKRAADGAVAAGHGFPYGRHRRCSRSAQVRLTEPVRMPRRASGSPRAMPM
ncbi:hypothetical protein [Streptomyces sp900129855]|uniref:NADPH-dependent reductive aminase-like C-terminal domain-containing protein n=1 Tax=Streptomyces sp. 900129855 TaxID=3155129 RepID=A0ABV2ZE56_9ACTN